MDHLTGLPPQCWEELPERSRQIWDPLISTVNLPPLFLETACGRLDPATYDPQKITSLAERDPVLGARLLAIANSASFGLIQPISSIQRAVVHLGMRLVESVILSYNMEVSFSHVPTFPRSHLEYSRAWAASSSVLAQHICENLDGLDAGALSTGALLSRLGVLLLGLGQPCPGDEYVKQACATSRIKLEYEKWSISSALLSYRLLEEWKLPEPLPTWAKRCDEPVLNHMQHDDIAARALGVIAGANVLAAHYISDREIIPSLLLDKPNYSILLHNLRQLDLYEPVIEVFNRKIVRRELEGACMSTQPA